MEIWIGYCFRLIRCYTNRIGITKRKIVQKKQASQRTSNRKTNLSSRRNILAWTYLRIILWKISCQRHHIITKRTAFQSKKLTVHAKNHSINRYPFFLKNQDLIPITTAWNGLPCRCYPFIIDSTRCPKKLLLKKNLRSVQMWRKWTK